MMKIWTMICIKRVENFFEKKEKIIESDNEFLKKFIFEVENDYICLLNKVVMGDIIDISAHNYRKSWLSTQVIEVGDTFVVIIDQINETISIPFVYINYLKIN